MKVKKNDLVLVIKGKDKGKKGKVIKALPKQNRILVEGINLAKKHLKPKRQGAKGEIVLIPRPLSVSNVKVICPICSQPTRIGYQITEKEKLRKCKKCQGTFK